MNSSWFLHNTYSDEQWAVIKIPKTTRWTSYEKEARGRDIHWEYLWGFLAETQIETASEHGYTITQEEIIGTPTDIMNSTSEQINTLLEKGMTMQSQEWILFDVFWMESMVALFNHYFKWTYIKRLSDLLLPVNAQYLKLMHNFKPQDLYKMNNQDINIPFVSHNILKEDGTWDIKFIDTDYRPLQWNKPLNLVGNWITQKALTDIAQNRWIKIRI